MNLVDNMRNYIADLILPEVNYGIGRRQRIGAFVSSKPMWAYRFYTDGEFDPELVDCIPINGTDKLSLTEGRECDYNRLHTGEPPKVGEEVTLDVFISGLATGVNFGVHKLKVERVIPKKSITEVLVCGNKFYNNSENYKRVPKD